MLALLAFIFFGRVLASPAATTCLKNVAFHHILVLHFLQHIPADIGNGNAVCEWTCKSFSKEIYSWHVGSRFLSNCGVHNFDEKDPSYASRVETNAFPWYGTQNCLCSMESYIPKLRDPPATKWCRLTEIETRIGAIWKAAEGKRHNVSGYSTLPGVDGSHDGSSTTFHYQILKDSVATLGIDIPPGSIPC
ncbi:hypothetical protein BCR37DRAFT_161424 [Protomyces lactucae-debilis]|uniref:Uncharacterized protein n=1 Tax=Protomyces lactucae-debilis TaxID=2754530 RepID=A0A1Y2EYB9_PROLT|nr:uncharacterized protein BCR37DRAFT_161424 [Protomyces lactucae-debilis]ORY76599.1 hypothetical protein BCR37DRAFT_161424 [Protomyces lactucae-debilis]